MISSRCKPIVASRRMLYFQVAGSRFRNPWIKILKSFRIFKCIFMRMYNTYRPGNKDIPIIGTLLTQGQSFISVKSSLCEQLNSLFARRRLYSIFYIIQTCDSNSRILSYYGCIRIQGISKSRDSTNENRLRNAKEYFESSVETTDLSW